MTGRKLTVSLVILTVAGLSGCEGGLDPGMLVGTWQSKTGPTEYYRFDAVGRFWHETADFRIGGPYRVDNGTLIEATFSRDDSGYSSTPDATRQISLVDDVLTIDGQAFRRVDPGEFEWADLHSDMSQEAVEWERLTTPKPAGAG